MLKNVFTCLQNKGRILQDPFSDSFSSFSYEEDPSERVNSQLKDTFGGRFVRVRGPKKVMAHLMFGVLALTAQQLLRLIT